jgi:uncharacterized membrane protein
MNMRIYLMSFLLLFAVGGMATLSFAGTSGPSPIPAPPNFQISTNAITLCKGIINTVPISIKTPVGAAKMQAVQISITNSRYAYTVGNGTVSAVNVSPNVTNTVPLLIFVSLNSTPLISVGTAINYQYLSLYSDSEVRNISFGVETCPSALSVTVSPGILTSDKIENISLGFTNTGNTTLNYLSIHSSIPSIDGTFLGSQPIQIASIAPKSSVQVSQRVFIYKNATQSFPINLSISLYNGTSLEQLSYNPIALSTGIINITPSSVTISPQTPTSGSIFSVSFVLTDIGTSSASAVTATALVPQGFEPYGSRSVFVGDMQVDSQTPVTITLTANSMLKGGSYNIPVEINYLNSLRQNLSTTIMVPVQIVATAGTFNALSGAARSYSRTGSTGGFLAIPIIMAIVIIILLFLFLRERKSHHKVKDEYRRAKELRERHSK